MPEQGSLIVPNFSGTVNGMFRLLDEILARELESVEELDDAFD
jgi:hypothetical protein